MSRITRRTVIPVNQITPLTYRDGVTYIELLTELSEYIKTILHPSLQHTVDQLVADVETTMDKHHDQYVDGVQEFQRIHDAFMSDVNASLIALNDTAVTDLFDDNESLFSQALKDMFVPMPIMRGPTIDPTGTRDSTQGIQEFLDAHPRQTVFLPEGIYRIHQIWLNQSQYIQGSGRSTYRDRYTFFGTPGWMEDANFGGTVIRSDYIGPEAAIHIYEGAGEVLEGGLFNMTVIGPGAGRSIGVQIGSDTPLSETVNNQLSNVMVGNFKTGVVMHRNYEGVFNPLIIRGCELALDLATHVNDNSFTGFEAQWCHHGVSIAETCYNNTFTKPIAQSISGLGFHISGSKNTLYNPYFEACDEGAIVLAYGANTNSIESPTIMRHSDTMTVEQEAADNVLSNVGWNGGATVVVNNGVRTRISGRIPDLTDTGDNTTIHDPMIPGTPLAAWKSFAQQLSGGWQVGNGTITSRYRRSGKTIQFLTTITFGTTSTFEGYTPTVQLPAMALYGAFVNAHITKSGSGPIALLAWTPPVGAESVTLYATDAQGIGVPLSDFHAVDMEAGDILEITGTYESI